MSDIHERLDLDPRVYTGQYDSEHVYETDESITARCMLVADLITEDVVRRPELGYDFAVIIGRGGFAPGNIIARRLNFPATQVLHIAMSSYERRESDSSGVMDQALEHHLGQIPSAIDNLSGRALLIDEVSDSGHSLKRAKPLLLSAGFETVTTAVLHWKDRKSSRPDYFAMVANGWIHYPWEVHDQVGENLSVPVARSRQKLGGTALLAS